MEAKTSSKPFFFFAVVEVILPLSLGLSKDVIIVIRWPSLVQPAVLRLTYRLVDCTVWVAKKIVEEQEFLHQSHGRSLVHDTSSKPALRNSKTVLDQ